MALEKPGKLRDFFLILCGHPVESATFYGTVTVHVIITRYVPQTNCHDWNLVVCDYVLQYIASMSCAWHTGTCLRGLLTFCDWVFVDEHTGPGEDAVCCNASNSEEGIWWLVNQR